MSTTNKGQLTKFNTFAVSAASGMSGWLFVHPMDVIKVRMQLENSNPAELRAGSPITLASNLVKNEGVLGLYSGLSAALLRQATYTTMRLALYDIFKDYTKGLTGVQMADQAAAAVTSGGIASFLACPVEVCLARMQADGALPVDQRRGYTGVVDAFRSIAAKEGLSTFFRGAAPTVARAAVVSTTQLVSYDQAKALYSSFLGEGVLLHFSSSLTAGFVYSFASLPLDTAKTRMQTQVPDAATGALRYTSLLGTISTIARTEGAASLWKGFGPYFARGGGHTVTMLLFKEQYTAAAKQYCQ